MNSNTWHAICFWIQQGKTPTSLWKLGRVVDSDGTEAMACYFFGRMHARLRFWCWLLIWVSGLFVVTGPRSAGIETCKFVEGYAYVQSPHSGSWMHEIEPNSRNPRPVSPVGSCYTLVAAEVPFKKSSPNFAIKCHLAKFCIFFEIHKIDTLLPTRPTFAHFFVWIFWVVFPVFFPHLRLQLLLRSTFEKFSFSELHFVFFKIIINLGSPFNMSRRKRKKEKKHITLGLARFPFQHVARKKMFFISSQFFGDFLKNWLKMQTIRFSLSRMCLGSLWVSSMFRFPSGANFVPISTCLPDSTCVGCTELLIRSAFSFNSHLPEFSTASLSINTEAKL